MQYLTFTGDKKAKRNGSWLPAMSLNRCGTISFCRNWLDLSGWWPQEACMEPVSWWVSSLRWSAKRKKPGWQESWCLNYASQSRHSLKQINTNQGAAEKQDGLVSLNKHQAACSQGPKKHSKSVFHSVFAHDLQPDPQAFPLWWEVFLYCVFLWHCRTPLKLGIAFMASASVWA